jgi:hypothetical protein
MKSVARCLVPVCLAVCVAATADAHIDGREPAAVVGDWHLGDEWGYRYESPSGSGTFVWVVDRVQSVSGREHYVVRSGQREIYYQRQDFRFTQVRPAERPGQDFERMWTVEDQETVTVLTGSFSTFRIVCANDTWARTVWYSPAVILLQADVISSSAARPSSPSGRASVSGSSKWLSPCPTTIVCSRPIARSASANSRDCRWNSGESRSP